MTLARKKHWSYSTGERGHNRVRVFEQPKTGKLFLELYEHGKRRRIALKHRDRKAAKANAEEVAMALRRNTYSSVPVTLTTLFDNYLREVTPGKSPSKQQHDRAATRRFLECFGESKAVATLNRRDSDAFITWRRSRGDERPGTAKGRDVGNRIVEYDLKFLNAVLNWATTVRDTTGAFLLERNPLAGIRSPSEPSPKRPQLTDEEYLSLLAVSETVDARFRLALLLAHETGHRIGAISQLRWSDIDFAECRVTWRPEFDKIGFEHVTPLTEEALVALESWRRTRRVIGDGFVFPSDQDSDQPMSRHRFRDWWRSGESKARLKRVSGRGWHSLRRKFATDMKSAPLKDLSYLGGWKDPTTVVKCYQAPDEATMRAALAGRNRHHQSTPSPPSKSKEKPA